LITRLRADATATPARDGRVVLEEGHIRMAIGPLGPGLAATLARLADGGATEAELAAATRGAEDEQAILKMHMLLRRLDASGWLERVAPDEDGRPMATLRAIGHQVPPPPRPPAPDAAVVLSRFATLHAVDDGLVASSPQAPLSVAVAPPLAALLSELARPALPSELEDRPGLSAATARAALALLAHAQVVVAADTPEPDALAHWNPADLLFHTRSRAGTNVGGYGGTYRLEGRVAPVPAIKPATGATTQLPVPDLDGLDMPLGRALESRRSIRRHDDDAPITGPALGEFLYRCARVRAVFDDGHQELSSRPYPGGGAVYELELYPLVRHAAGLAAGLYRYEPQGHQLELVAQPGPKLSLLLEYGQRTAAMESPPQVLILIAARFARAMWKYESMAYALVLKDVGVMYQTMYLVATALGLAPCSLGGGNSVAFADAAGLDPYAETSVGEFVLGSAARIE